MELIIKDVCSLSVPISDLSNRNVFSRFECEVLISIIAKYNDIIECKETNKVTNFKKQEAWISVEKEYNRTSGVQQRSAAQLRQKYLNLKKKVAKSSPDVQQEIRSTGSGKKTKFMDPIHERMLAAHVINKRMTTEYGSDSCYLDTLPIQDTPEMPHSPVHETSEEESDISDVDDDVLSSATPGSPSCQPPIITRISASQPLLNDVDEMLETPAGASVASRRASSKSLTTPGSSTHHSPPRKQISMSQPMITGTNESLKTLGRSSVAGRRVLEMFRKRTKSKNPVQSKTPLAAQVIMEESKARIKFERRKNEREELEHQLRMEILKTEKEMKSELYAKQIELENKKIQIQQKILDALEENPQSLNLHFK